MDYSNVRIEWLLSRISELSNEMETLYRLYGAEDKQYIAKAQHKSELIEEWRKRAEWDEIDPLENEYTARYIGRERDY